MKKRWLLPLGLAAAAYVVVAVRTSWMLVHPKRHFVPKDYEITQMPLERVQFPNRTGLNLAGWLAPRRQGPGTVVLCHGVWTNHREMESRAEALWNRGYNVMLFDFQGCGESEGRFSSLGLREVEDLLGALDFLSRRGGAGPIGVVGNSMGGAVALLTAAVDDRIRAVVTDSTFATADGAAAYGFRTATGLPAAPFKRAIVLTAQLMAGTRIAKIRPVDAVAALAGRPLLVIHCDADELVHPNDAVALFNAAAEPKELWLIPKGRHVESFLLNPDEYANRVDAFFRNAFAQDPAQDRITQSGRDSIAEVGSADRARNVAVKR